MFAPTTRLISSSLSTVVIDINDLYNEFNFGIYHPIAIKNFLRYAFQNWDTTPAYTLLVGDGHWNFHGHNLSDYGAGLQMMIADPLDEELKETIRIVEERDESTPVGRLYLSIHDAVANMEEPPTTAVDLDDPQQVAIWKTVQISIQAGYVITEPAWEED